MNDLFNFFQIEYHFQILPVDEISLPSRILEDQAQWEKQQDSLGRDVKRVQVIMKISSRRIDQCQY